MMMRKMNYWLVFGLRPLWADAIEVMNFGKMRIHRLLVH